MIYEGLNTSWSYSWKICVKFNIFFPNGLLKSLC